MGRTIRAPRKPAGRRLVAIGMGAAAAVAFATATALPAAADGVVVDAGGPTAIPRSYIVVLDRDVTAAANVGALAGTLAARHDATIEHTYTSALHGFAATMSEKAARRLAADPA